LNCDSVINDIIPLTKGTVTSIQEDPFNDKNDWIYLVNWDSGETVSLLGCVDLWLKDDAD